MVCFGQSFYIPFLWCQNSKCLGEFGRSYYFQIKLPDIYELIFISKKFYILPIESQTHTHTCVSLSAFVNLIGAYTPYME